MADQATGGEGGDRVIGGIDLGGTKLAAVLGRADGTVLATERWSMQRDLDPSAALDEAAEWLARMAETAGVLEAVGLACPGPLSYEQGRLLEVPNMPAWQFFEVGSWMASRFSGLPHRFMNDANAGVCAEVRFGAAQGARSAAFLTFSTGMGAGLWLDGRLYEGPRALAGEVGHLRLEHDGPVGFGKAGSVEGFCSGPGVEQMAKSARWAAIQRGERVDFGPEASVREVFEAARRSDPCAVAVVDRVARSVGRVAALLADLLDLDCVVLGTIGQAWFTTLEPGLREAFRGEVLRPLASVVQIVPSPLVHRGESAALAVALEALETA